MKLFVGLGNIGNQYEKTRHNLGFLFVDSLFEYYETKTMREVSQWKEEKIFNAQIAQVYDQSRVKIAMLTKPTTMMNNSGLAVAKIAKKNSISVDSIFVAFDDLDLPFGDWRVAKNKYPKAHNGLISIQNHLSTTDFWYVRIGSESRTQIERQRIPGEDYVLSQLSKDELLSTKFIFDSIIAELNSAKCL